MDSAFYALVKLKLYYLNLEEKKNIDCDLKLKLNRRRLYPTNSIKYLGVETDENLGWKQQIDRFLP